MPAPVSEAPHLVDPLPPDIGGEHRPKPVPPKPHCLMAQVDAAFEQQVLDVPQGQWEADIHHHHEADHLGRRVEIPEWIGGLARAGHSLTSPVAPLHR